MSPIPRERTSHTVLNIDIDQFATAADAANYLLLWTHRLAQVEPIGSTIPVYVPFTVPGIPEASGFTSSCPNEPGMCYQIEVASGDLAARVDLSGSDPIVSKAMAIKLAQDEYMLLKTR